MFKDVNVINDKPRGYSEIVDLKIVKLDNIARP